MLQAAFVRSEIPHGRIVKIALPPLPEGYRVVDGRDLYDNHLLVITAEQPVFAMDEVSYIGEAILLIVGPDLALARQLCRETKVTYQELPAVLDMEKANAVAAHYHFAKGDVAAAFAGAAQIVEETFTTGYQEQAYLEPQGMLACWDAGEEKITVYGTMQCPYYVHSSLMHALHLDSRHVRVVQEVTGGGFGGKEEKVKIWSERLRHKGAVLAVLGFLPFVGEVIEVALGYLRSNAWLVCLFICVGKGLRYFAWMMAHIYMVG